MNYNILSNYCLTILKKIIKKLKKIDIQLDLYIKSFLAIRSTI
jgi:hypothetical protein